MASFPSGFKEGIVCCFVCAWAHTSLWSCLRGFLGRYREALRNFWALSGVSWGASGTSWGGFWELRGRLGRLLGAPGASGDASGCFGGVSGRLLGASRASQRGSWELPRRPGERLGVLLGRLGKPFGAPREQSVGSGKDTKVKIIVFLKEFIGF